MTIARKNIVDKEQAGFYHCTNRCVRRAFLCGFDEASGINYDHRKDWLENRMVYLAEVFAVDIYAYAVMSNHYHLVLYLDPKSPSTWSDEEIARRWLKAFPIKAGEESAQWQMRLSALIDSPEKLAVYRKRLGDLSWFMRCLNEPLAKLSNKQDVCKGKFWQERFHAQALLDEAAVISCMAYVDLNPVRARIVEKLEESNHTAIKKRLEQAKASPEQLEQKLLVMAGTIQSQKLDLKLREYIELVEWTGKNIVHPGKASLPPHISSCLQRLNLQSNHWLKHIEHFQKNHCHVVGAIDRIRDKARQIKKRCLKGIAAAKLAYL